MIILAGGSSDHNMHTVVRACENAQLNHMAIWTDRPAELSFTFNALSARLNGQDLTKDAHSLFSRHDTFLKPQIGKGDKNYPLLSKMTKAELSQFSDDFIESLRGYALSRPHDFYVLNNRAGQHHDVNKIRNLNWAKEAGFTTPVTHTTNDIKSFEAEAKNWIAKPVAGGAYTQRLSDIFALAADDLEKALNRPWFVQEALAYPEIRLYQIGEEQFAFIIENTELDSRSNTDNLLLFPTEVPENLKAPMRNLSARLGLDYSAADFKTDPNTGQLKFLEINTMPMITGYDRAAGGQLSESLVQFLHKKQLKM
jgi:glutathione synthase/RimK-type ligase-like ATP-grasp enzyme